MVVFSGSLPQPCQIVKFITNLDQHHKMLLFRGLQLPVDNIATNSVKDFLLQLLHGRIYKIRTEELLELKAS